MTDRSWLNRESGDALVKFQRSELAEWGKAVRDADVRL
jgi:hypothetical protein